MSREKIVNFRFEYNVRLFEHQMISSDKYMSCKIVDLDESYKTVRLIQSRLVLTYLLSYYIIHSTNRTLFILPVERSHNSRIDFLSI
jgi:hypothetical protein